jgi:BirA family biotin operon repressor/biotin-[acetyl-CoA-carboxylase] ligase
VSAKIKPDKLQESLRTKRFGKKVFFSHKVSSTNEWAKELAKLGADEGTVTVAGTQTAGHGRLNREWISPEGGLWFSIVLRRKVRAAEGVQLVFVVGLAVAEVLRGKYGVKVETKWPNDVLVNGKKICGILIEMNTTGQKVNYIVAGIGINVNFDVRRVLPEQLREVATSLENELGRKIRLEELFRALLENLEKIYDLYILRGFTPVLEEWKKHANFLGHKVEVTNQKEKLSGLALDVDDEGALVLKLEDGKTRHVFVGDVSLHVSPSEAML